MELFEALANRRSVRKFRAEALPTETVERILEAANLAPSAKNGQQWRFHVLCGTKKDTLADVLEGRARQLSSAGVEVGSAVNSARIIKEAPTLVVVTNSGSLSGGLKSALEQGPVGASIWSAEIQSVSAAVQNMLLAAHALGVGSLWICDVFVAYQEILEILGTKQDLVAAVALGYPDAEARSPAKKDWKELTTFV